MRHFVLTVLSAGLLACSGNVAVDETGAEAGNWGPLTLSPAMPMKTWAQCRTLHEAGDLSPEMKADCDFHHTEPPTDFEYRVRWMVLDDSNATMESLVEEHLLAANALYAPAGLSFRTHDYLVHPDPLLDLFKNGGEFVTIGELAADIAVYFDMPSSEPEAVFEQLKLRLKDVGVSQTALDDLRLYATMSSQKYWRLIARAFGEEVVIFVAQPSSEESLRGISGSPVQSHDEPSTSMVFLRYEKMDNIHGVLAHELGHYMGLAHTFRGENAAEDQLESTVDLQSLAELYISTFDSTVGMKGALADLVKVDGSLRNNFVPYDAPTNDVEQAERRRLAATAYLPAQRFTYHDQRQPYSSLSAFVAALDNQSKPVYLKNFVRDDMPDNNCFEASVGQLVRCHYQPDTVNGTTVTVNGYQSFLDGSIASAEGTLANLMSYIRLDGTTHENPLKFLTSEQLSIVELSAISPVRLNLRNTYHEP